MRQISLDAIGPGDAPVDGYVVTYDEATGRLVLKMNLDAEAVRDAVATTLVAGPGVSIDVDDAADTITISAPIEPTRQVPLTTVVGGVPQLVWDDDDNLVMTEVPR